LKKLFVLILSVIAAAFMAGCMPKSIAEVAQNAGNSVTANNEGTGTGYAEDGYAEGSIGDTMHTYFFDFTVTSAHIGTAFDGLVPAEGYKFIAVEVTIKNATGVAQPMSLLDFQIQWDAAEDEDPDDAYDYPLAETTTDENGNTEWTSLSDRQLPAEWELEVDEERTGILLYAVPEDSSEYSIAYMEIFESEDNTDDEEYGDVFFVYFSADETK
jgi:hypothetical protein